MQKKLFLSHMIIIVIILLIIISSIGKGGYKYIYEQNNAFYLQEAKLIGDLFLMASLEEEEFEIYLTELANKYDLRITLIDKGGHVIVDTSGKDVDNHSTREEVSKALNGESNSIIRQSKTMGEKYAYSAVPINQGNFQGVIRISVPLDELSLLDNALIDKVTNVVIISLLLAGVFALIASKFISKPIIEISKAAKSVAKGDYNTKIYINSNDQVGELANSFNLMIKSMKLNMANIKQNNRELEAMLNSIRGSVVALDESNKILFYNNNFKQLVGDKASKEAMEGVLLYNIIRDKILYDIVESVREIKSMDQKEGRLGYDNKQILITGTPFKLGFYKGMGILLIIEDVTEIRKLENIRSEFVSNVSHELKTPLTSIVGFIDTLKAGAIEDKKVAYTFLEIIEVEAERLTKLIEEILALSELEAQASGQVEGYKEKLIDIDKLIEEIIELIKDKVPKEVELIYKKNAEPLLVLFNENRIKQIIINLLDNSIKYTEKGFIKIQCNKNNDNDLIIEVIDTGIGIAEEDSKRIFERFYRVDKGRARKQGGTGLGLAIVKHIVELYNGSIEVESKEGEGSKFLIRLGNSQMNK